MVHANFLAILLTGHRLTTKILALHFWSIQLTVNGKFSRREREIMEVLYRQPGSTVSQVLEQMPDPPSYSSVRALLAILEQKGHVSHTKTGSRYLYTPATPRKEAARSALSQLVNTFFGGSTESVVATLLSTEELNLSVEQLNRLGEMIEAAKAGKDLES